MNWKGVNYTVGTAMEVPNVLEEKEQTMTSSVREVNMKMKRYEVNVRETALQLQEKQSNFQI